MLFRRCTESQLHQALDVANATYGNNLRLVDCRQRGSAIRARIAAINGRMYGARTSASGRHGPYASWEAYRDVFYALFAINPQAVLVTSMAKYTADNFEATYPATGHVNVGSKLCPVTMPELSI